MNLDKIYPVGALYLSVKATSPATLFGGTWARISGRALVGVDTGDTDFDTAGKTGGAKTHTLTVAQMAVHSHAFTSTAVASSTDGTHHHTLSTSGSGYGPGFPMAGTDGVFSGYVNTVAHSHGTYTPAGTLSAAGSNVAHNNLQPYITCYIWYRAA